MAPQGGELRKHSDMDAAFQRTYGVHHRGLTGCWCSSTSGEESVDDHQRHQHYTTSSNVSHPQLQYSIQGGRSSTSPSYRQKQDMATHSGTNQEWAITHLHIRDMGMYEWLVEMLIHRHAGCKRLPPQRRQLRGSRRQRNRTGNDSKHCWRGRKHGS